MQRLGIQLVESQKQNDAVVEKSIKIDVLHRRGLILDFELIFNDFLVYVHQAAWEHALELLLNRKHHFILRNDVNFNIVDDNSGYGIDIIDEFICLLFFQNGQYIQIKT